MAAPAASKRSTIDISPSNAARPRTGRSSRSLTLGRFTMWLGSAVSETCRHSNHRTCHDRLDMGHVVGLNGQPAFFHFL